jgi:DNA-binding GntR family transcriptional regulator
MALQPLAGSKVLIDLVHERIVEAIADGTLRPGQRLRQDEVAALLGVSRQPVSHALQLAKRQGLVVEHGRKGLAVAPVEAARTRHLYQVRAALDALAARLAAALVRDHAHDRQALHALEASLEAGQRLPADAAAGALIQADVALHTAIYRLAANPAIEETIAPQWPHFRRSMGAVLLDPACRPRVWIEHAAIVERIVAGRPEAAAAAAREHAERAGQEAAARLEDRAEAA